MEKRTIGKSGIEVSAMAMGAWAIGGGITWGENDDEESISCLLYTSPQQIQKQNWVL